MTLWSVGSIRRQWPGAQLRASLPVEEAARLPRDAALLLLLVRPLGAAARECVAAALRERRPDLTGDTADAGDAARVLAAGNAVLADARPELLELAARAGARVATLDVLGGRIRLGAAVEPAALRGLASGAAHSHYLAWLAAALRSRAQHGPAPASPELGTRVPIAPPAAPAALRRELESLPEGARLLENEHWLVAYARGSDIPALLHEIGRAREESFRDCGEGTGAALDLDRFDPCYFQLFAWSKTHGELAAAYRLAETSTLLSRGGSDALYTSTLFAYEPAFFARLGPALELGRAFVRPAHQRSLALALVWRALARVLQTGGYRSLFGAVSVSP